MKPSEFCILVSADKSSHAWLCENYPTMDAAWNDVLFRRKFAAFPNNIIWIATRPGVLTDRELRLCAVQAAFQVAHLFTNQLSHLAIDAAARHANGQATDEELKVMRDNHEANVIRPWEPEVQSLAYITARIPQRDAAHVAAYTLKARALDAAWGAAQLAAQACMNSTSSSRRQEAYDNSLAITTEWLRANTKPDWNRAREVNADYLTT